MTKKEFVDRLDMFDDNEEIYIAFPSHDYWGTIIARKVTEVREQELRYSKYHECDALVEGDERDREGIKIGVVIQ